MNIHDIIRLSELLGEMGHVRRATHLPNGEPESDSHHSFSLALIAYYIVKNECPDLDADKVLLFALAHDLLEIITGDEDTLHFTSEQQAAKQAREEQAVAEFDEVFVDYPELRNAMHDYEKLDTQEAVSVFVLDKACTTWTHHPDKAEYARVDRGLKTKADIEAWADRQREKIKRRVKIEPPQQILDVYEDSFRALSGLYDN